MAESLIDEPELITGTICVKLDSRLMRLCCWIAALLRLVVEICSMRPLTVTFFEKPHKLYGLRSRSASTHSTNFQCVAIASATSALPMR